MLLHTEKERELYYLAEDQTTAVNEDQNPISSPIIFWVLK